MRRWLPQSGPNHFFWLLILIRAHVSATTRVHLCSFTGGGFPRSLFNLPRICISITLDTSNVFPGRPSIRKMTLLSLQTPSAAASKDDPPRTALDMTGRIYAMKEKVSNLLDTPELALHLIIRCIHPCPIMCICPCAAFVPNTICSSS